MGRFNNLTHSSTWATQIFNRESIPIVVIPDMCYRESIFPFFGSIHDKNPEDERGMDEFPLLAFVVSRKSTTVRLRRDRLAEMTDLSCCPHRNL